MKNVNDVDVKSLLPYERIKYYREEVVKLSQSKFANNLKISKSNLANIEVGRVNLTDRVISEICEAYNINEEWIKFGNEPMQKQKSRDEEILDFFKKIKDTNNVFAKRFILALSKLDVQDWEALDKLITNYMELSKSDVSETIDEIIMAECKQGRIEHPYTFFKVPKRRSSVGKLIYNRGKVEHILPKNFTFDSTDEENVLPMIAEKPKK